MTEAGIGRILVASLHQGIADVLPMRLEFYEHWLHPEGLRHGTIGLAPLNAVLSFLRQEGEAYHQTCRQAGAHAAEWVVASQWPARRTVTRAMPLSLRSIAVMRLARTTFRRTYVGTRAVTRLRRGEGTVDVKGSLFCNTRESSAEPLCTYYSAVLARLLELYAVPAEVSHVACRASGDSTCLMRLAIRRTAAATGEATPAA